MEEVDKAIHIRELAEFGTWNFDFQLSHRAGNDFDDIQTVGAEIFHRSRHVDIGGLEIAYDLNEMFADYGGYLFSIHDFVILTT
jgi:hypothetical protein